MVLSEPALGSRESRIALRQFRMNSKTLLDAANVGSVIVLWVVAQAA